MEWISGASGPTTIRIGRVAEAILEGTNGTRVKSYRRPDCDPPSSRRIVENERRTGENNGQSGALDTVSEDIVNFNRIRIRTR